MKETGRRTEEEARRKRAMVKRSRYRGREEGIEEWSNERGKEGRGWEKYGSGKRTAR